MGPHGLSGAGGQNNSCGLFLGEEYDGGKLVLQRCALGMRTFLYYKYSVSMGKRSLCPAICIFFLRSNFDAKACRYMASTS